MSAAHEQTADEHRAFVGMIGDILRATPDLHFELHVAETVDHEGPYAIFTITTNPEHEGLMVSIEVTLRAFRLHINGRAFTSPVGSVRRIDRWMEKRCRDVERLTDGDLKVDEESLLGTYLSSEVSAGRDGKWTEIAEGDDGWGWLGLLGWLAPFWFSPFRNRSVEYKDWFRVPPRDGVAESAPPP